MLAWLQDRFYQVPAKVKALLAVLATVALALADAYDQIPFAPLLSEYLGEHAATKLAVWLPVIFGVLRYVSGKQPVNDYAPVHHVHRGIDEPE